MSRIGKKPVTIPEKVELQLNDGNIVAKGAMGELTLNFESEFVSFSQKDGKIVVSRKDDSKTARSRHGLYRSLLENLVQGVDKGFKKSLEIRGVGYRAAVKGKILDLSLGFSHPIHFDIPEGIEVKADSENANILHVSGMNKQLVGQVAAEIRSYRKPEPYKGKGIRYTDEQVARKAGKAAAK
jgi:large subunit ribosomal protein L6